MKKVRHGHPFSKYLMGKKDEDTKRSASAVRKGKGDKRGAEALLREAMADDDEPKKPGKKGLFGHGCEDGAEGMNRKYRNRKDQGASGMLQDVLEQIASWKKTGIENYKGPNPQYRRGAFEAGKDPNHTRLSSIVIGGLNRRAERKFYNAGREDKKVPDVKGYVPDEDKREGDPRWGSRIGPFPPKARAKNKEASKAAIGKASKEAHADLVERLDRKKNPDKYQSSTEALRALMQRAAWKKGVKPYTGPGAEHRVAAFKAGREVASSKPLDLKATATGIKRGMAEKSLWKDKDGVEKRWGKYGDPGPSAREKLGWRNIYRQLYNDPKRYR
jgi:hypothetical protein